MANINMKELLATQLRRLKYFRHNVRLVVAWFLACLILEGLLWGTTLSILRHKREQAKDEAFKTVASLADGYAERLELAAEQIDRITRLLKHEWETTHALQLEDESKEGILPLSAHLYVSIVGRNGTILTSTLSKKNAPDVSNQEYFRVHKAGQISGQFISQPSKGLLSGKTVVRFSRRLNSHDDSFDGVVVASVEPAYFGSFTGKFDLDENDFISVKRADGVLLATQLGHSINSEKNPFRSSPQFDAQSGVAQIPGNEFADGQAHFVAWHRLKNYPLMAIVGMDEEGIFAPYQAKKLEYMILATGGSVVLFLVMMTGMFIYSRLAWRKQQAEQVKDAYRLATDVAREGFYMLRALCGRDGAIIDFLVKDCNERGAAYYGKTREELNGTRFSDYSFMEDWQEIFDTYCRAMETGYYEGEGKVSSDSPLQARWIHRKLMRSGNGLAVTLRDISDLKEHEEELSRTANKDAVTSLPNRHWLMHYLPAVVERAKHRQALLAVLFIDLDDFKNVNDTLGHDAGDELLCAVAGRLTNVVRPQDHVVRLGGDEFTVILEQIDSEEDIYRVAERIVSTLSEPFSFECGINYPVLGSIGISVFPRDGTDSNTLLKHADVAMYAAKTNGKGQFRFYTPELSESLLSRLYKEQALRRAIERDEFEMHYQPRVDTFSGALRGLEALIRWTDSERSAISPMEFIPLAEETGLIVPLGELVIRKVCEQIGQWKTQHLPVVPVSINVSARQFNHGKLSALFASCMAQYGVEPSLLEVEITESCMLGDDDKVTAEVTALEALGVKFIVDDFGTGYSSLSQLQRLDLDAVKVDRAFTGGLDSGKGEAFYMAILSMAHVLDMTVVAEGVETIEQLRTLQALSCNQVQGFLISPPQPASDIPALLLKRFLLPKSEFARHIT